MYVLQYKTFLNTPKHGLVFSWNDYDYETKSPLFGVLQREASHS
jgi:hypothetical protein